MWLSKSRDRNISLSDKYSLQKTLGDPIEIRKWGINGLPGDSVSIDNAIITTKSQQWPMIIDPQFQASNWLKKMFRHSEQTFTSSKMQKTSLAQGK